MSCDRPRTQGKNWIAQLQQREIASTGIKSLKVRFNSVFGYFIEITKSNLANAPAHYIRKQTTVGGERFITPELKEMEAKILGADERAKELEYQLFQSLRDEVLPRLAPIQQTRERRSGLSTCFVRWPKRRASSITAGRCSTTLFGS